MREINYTIDVNGITPSSLQEAGFQSDYNATKVIFTLTDGLLGQLKGQQGNPNWSVEALNAEGVLSILPLSFKGSTAELLLPHQVTLPGTTAQLQPVVTMLDDEYNILSKQCYPILKVRFGPSVAAMVSKAEQERYSNNLIGAMEIALSSAQRAEIAAKGDVWNLIGTRTLTENIISLSEQVEQMGSTHKGVRVKVKLPANTALVNNRLVVYITLSGNRLINFRVEGWVPAESNTVCCFEIKPFGNIWNVETAPYTKTIASITGDISCKEDDKVRYIKLLGIENNPIPVGTVIEFWGLE